MTKKTIITIGRQFGSGGRLIGQKLATQLNIPFYDKELISLASQKTGLSPEVYEQADEKAASGLLYSSLLGTYPLGLQLGNNYNMPVNDKLFLAQSSIIKEAAAAGSCVIIGRCANYVLKDDPDCISLFIHAPIKVRIDRALEEYQMPAARIEEAIEKIDKRRAAYYNYYADTRWGKIGSYHFSMDSSVLGIDGTAALIAALIGLKERRD